MQNHCGNRPLLSFLFFKIPLSKKGKKWICYWNPSGFFFLLVQKHNPHSWFLMTSMVLMQSVFFLFFLLPKWKDQKTVWLKCSLTSTIASNSPLCLLKRPPSLLGPENTHPRKSVSQMCLKLQQNGGNSWDSNRCRCRHTSFFVKPYKCYEFEYQIIDTILTYMHFISALIFVYSSCNYFYPSAGRT